MFGCPFPFICEILVLAGRFTLRNASHSSKAAILRQFLLFICSGAEFTQVVPYEGSV